MPLLGTVSMVYEDLTGLLGLPVVGVDIVVVGQCWHEALVDGL